MGRRWPALYGSDGDDVRLAARDVVGYSDEEETWLWGLAVAPAQEARAGNGRQPRPARKGWATGDTRGYACRCADQESVVQARACVASALAGDAVLDGRIISGLQVLFGIEGEQNCLIVVAPWAACILACCLQHMSRTQQRGVGPHIDEVAH